MNHSKKFIPSFASNIILRVKRPIDHKSPKVVQTIGDHLRRHRLREQISQSVIAGKIRVSSNTISNWENNHTQPKIKYIPSIIELLGYNPLKMGSSSNLSEKVIQYRKIFGFSQKKLAALIGVDEETIIRLENGANCIKRTLSKVDAFLAGNSW